MVDGPACRFINELGPADNVRHVSALRNRHHSLNQHDDPAGLVADGIQICA